MKVEEIIKMSREDLIAWLVNNDSNGCYEDEEHEAEFGDVMDLESAMAHVLNQSNSMAFYEDALALVRHACDVA